MSDQEFARDRLVVVLAVVSGATDALGFLSLGGVFASVMTGNMVLLGLGISKPDSDIVVHTALALVCYIAGCFLGARLGGYHRPEDGVWPEAVTRTLVAEWVLFVAVAVGWIAVDHDPGSVARAVFLGLSAIALGLQSNAILRFGVGGLSATYLTGTLTTAVRDLVFRENTSHVRRSAFILAGLIIGAALSTLLVRYLPITAPLLEVVALGGVIVASLQLRDR